MGQETSKETNPDLTNYTQIKSLNNPTYGEVIVWRNKSSLQTVCTTTSILHDEERYIQAEAQCKKLIKLNHENIVQLLNIKSEQHDQFCSSFFQVNLLYEYVEYSLSDDIVGRKQNSKPYQENELWHIIVSAVAALKYLKFNAINDGDIRPSTLLIDYEGRVKILPRPIFSTKNSSYAEFQQDGIKHGVYLSPQLLTSLAQSNLIPTCNLSKSDVYTLGLSILEAINLQPLQDLYDFDHYKINQQIVDQVLQVLKTMGYSQELQDFLKTMLESDEDKRRDVEDLFQQIETLCNNKKILVSDRLYSLKIDENASLPPQVNQFQILKQEKYEQFKQEEEEEVKRRGKVSEFKVIEKISSPVKVESVPLKVISPKKVEMSPKKEDQEVGRLQSPYKTKIGNEEILIGSPKQPIQQISSGLKIPVPENGTLLEGRYKVLHTEVKTFQGLQRAAPKIKQTPLQGLLMNQQQSPYSKFVHKPIGAVKQQIQPKRGYYERVVLSNVPSMRSLQPQPSEFMTVQSPQGPQPPINNLKLPKQEINLGNINPNTPNGNRVVPSKTPVYKRDIQF